MSEPISLDEAAISLVVRHMGLGPLAFGQDDSNPRYTVLRELGSIDVCACPGSGKTTLLVAKLGSLASTWEPAGQGVCVLSHTNVARHEIEEKLGSIAAGRRLLSYPHFVGTIHKFVNEFFALPWLAANGTNVSTIDTETALATRLNLLHATIRETFLERSKTSALEFVSPNLRLGPVKWGKNILGENAPTYKKLERAVRISVERGIFTHGEMFVWANDFLDKRPSFIEAIRKRFPIVFIDEAQDTTSQQGKFLHRIFQEGQSRVVVQRFGDSNQAIYGDDDVDEQSVESFGFPQAAIMRTLPESRRFGQKIADLADPLGLQPYQMTGNGPFTPTAVEPPHTIFLFHDEEGAKKIPDAFAGLLAATFTPQQLEGGVFKAVAQVHRGSEPKNFPRNISHYWDLYDPAVSKNQAKPRTLLEYVLHGRSGSEATSNSFSAVDGIAGGVLKFLEIVEAPIQELSPGYRSRHRKVLSALADHPESLMAYQKLVTLVGIRRDAISKVKWEGEIVPLVKSVVGCAFGTGLADSVPVDFISWTEANVASVVSSSTATVGNSRKFSIGGANFSIQFGSIHSVKGETHTATLVLETFRRTHNMAAIAPWFIGKNAGLSKKSNNEELNRLKLHYVAMTRPSHLLCLALHKDSFLKKVKKDLPTTVAALRARGWDVREV